MRGLLLVLGVLCGAVQACRGDDWLAERGWHLRGKGEATLTRSADGLAVGLKDRHKSVIVLTCDPPIVLPTDARRLTLWVDPASMGNAAPWKVLQATIHAQVRDAQGTLHRFPLVVGSICNRGWGQLATEDLAHAPYRPATEKPRPPLRLVAMDICTTGLAAFRLHGLRADNEAHRLPAVPWEVVSLTDPAQRQTWHGWSGSGIEYDGQGWDARPGLTLDALVNKPGDYTLGIQLRDGWQGPLASQWRQDIALPAAGFETARRRMLSLPVPHPGTYFVEARVWRPDHTLLTLKHFLLFAPEESERSAAGIGAKSAAGGYLTLTTARPGHVFAAEETPGFVLRVLVPPSAGKKRLHVLLANYQFDTLKEELFDIPETAKDGWSTQVAFPTETVDACRAFVELTVDGRLVDKDCLVLGKRRPEATPRPGNGGSGGASSAKPLPNAMTASALLVYTVPPQGLDAVARVGRGMDQAVRSGNRVVEIQVPWRDLEPLPGLYQFAALDRILDLAAAKGLKVMLAPWLLSDHMPRWLLPHVACYEDGSSGFIGGSHHAPSAADPVVRQAFAKLWQALARRYGQHPALGGYLVVGPALDLGHWHNGLLHETDYSPAVIASFQNYLKSVCHDSLPDLGRRYGQSLAAWAKVLPPAKDWSKELDLRPQWTDFCAYQQWELYQWMESIYSAVRTVDLCHDLVQYNFVCYGPQEYYYPLFKKYRVVATTGGTEGDNYQRFVSLYHLWGLRSRGGETIQTVQKWNLFASLFNMLAYGDTGGYYAVQWHEAFPEPWDSEPDGAQLLKQWSTSTVGGGWLLRVKSLDFAPDFANASRVLKELSGTEPLPLEAGCFSSYGNCLYKLRTMMPYFVSGGAIGRAWQEKEHRLPVWISESTPPALYHNLKLLVADADIPAMTRTTAKNLRDYVQAGGCLATFVPCGRYTVETGEPDFNFLAGLGFPKPSLLQDAKDGLAAKGSDWLGGETLVFKNLYRVQLPPQTQTLACLPDGTPCVVQSVLGAGQIVLFLGELDWQKSGHVLEALCRHRTVRRWCDATDSRVKVFALRRHDVRYVFAYYADRRRDPAALPPPVSAAVRIHHFTEAGYDVTELIENRTMGAFTFGQLENGLPVTLQPGELKILKCEPANAKPQF